MSGTKTFYEKLDGISRHLLDANDRLRDILEGESIKLPTIAVIGSQSAGKSSILERLSGIDLPRGAGMVTRCALVMQLKHQDLKETVVSIKYGDKSFEKIKSENLAQRIRSITDEIAPGRMICTDQKIDVQISSKFVKDLTVIDLPGLAYSDDTGGGREVCDRIKALYKQYIEDENCVIACVLPASQDVATQEAYTVAREADPSGKRTIGVVTKIDTIEVAHGPTIVQRLKGKGDNAWSFLLGTHAIRNRNQIEIDEGASREDVDKAEEAFFATHDQLSRVSAEDKATMLGFASLESKLVTVQSRIIKENFPSIEKRIRQTLAEKKKELKAMPTCVATDAEAQEALRQLTGQLRECFQKLYVVDYSMGKSLDLSDAACPDGLSAAVDITSEGANGTTGVPDWLKMMPRIQGVLARFEEEIRCAGQPIMTQGYAEKVRKELKDVDGYTLPDLMSQRAVMSLAAAEIDAFEEPTQAMLDDVHEYFSALCSVLIRKIFQIYPQLSDHVSVVVDKMLEESLENCRERLAEQLKVESEDVYTLNHYYSDTVLKIMARSDEVLIEATHQSSEMALLVISEGRSLPTVIISGAVGINSGKVNGLYVATTEVFGGQTVYHKRQGDNSKQLWLEFRNDGDDEDEEEGQWVIVSAEGKGGKSAGRYAFLATERPKIWENSRWSVWNGTTLPEPNPAGKFELQTLFARLQEQPMETAAVPLHNNFERCVKETQIRLWCYHKVVHKAFCDTMAKFVRYQFPRRLKDHVEAAVHQSLQVETEGASALHGSTSPLLLALMAETEELSRQRKTLQTSVRRHEEALAVMVELKKTMLALHDNKK